MRHQKELQVKIRFLFTDESGSCQTRYRAALCLISELTKLVNLGVDFRSISISGTLTDSDHRFLSYDHYLLWVEEEDTTPYDSVSFRYDDHPIKKWMLERPDDVKEIKQYHK